MIAICLYDSWHIEIADNTDYISIALSKVLLFRIYNILSIATLRIDYATLLKPSSNTNLLRFE